MIIAQIGGLDGLDHQDGGGLEGSTIRTAVVSTGSTT